MFNMTDLYGDIAAFKNLTKLRRLTFNPGNTGTRLNLYGDIANISNKPDLVYVELAKNNLSGSINDLVNLPNLVSFGISYSQNVTGDISNLRNFTQLYGIDVRNTSITGSVNSLANLLLRALYVNNLSALTNLEKLYIADQLVNSDYQMTNLIYGDIKAFANCTGLKEISIGSSLNLTGSISVFANCPNLGMLRLLMSPNISGNISVLENCNIFHISISGYTTAIMKVTGDISVFRSKNMINIYIHYTSVYGDISSLDNQARLTALAVNNLTNLRISGINIGDHPYN